MAPKERAVVKGQLKEAVNYPPCEPQSDYHRQMLVEMELYPPDGVGRYTRSIPFKGGKGGFLEKTGRSRFDVFEYRFTAPNVKGERKQWWVMWDYYNGLVRVHDLFDCCKPGKTEPGNAVKVKVNPGLASVCHNITGGNLHAQGYWIPYDAAKALAAKFCFKIRFALTVIFGESFPNQCLPESHPDFGKYEIDPRVIEACQQRSADQLSAEQRRSNPLRPTPLDPPQHLGREQPQWRFDVVRDEWVTVHSGKHERRSLLRVDDPKPGMANKGFGGSNAGKKSEAVGALPPMATFYPPDTTRRRTTRGAGSLESVRDSNVPGGGRGRARAAPPVVEVGRQVSEKPFVRRASTRRRNTPRGTTAGGMAVIETPHQATGPEKTCSPPIKRPKSRKVAPASSVGPPLPPPPPPPPAAEQRQSASHHHTTPTRFALATFTQPRRNCRSDSYSGGGGSTMSHTEFEGIAAAAAVEEEEPLENVLAVEAAGNLMRLRLDEYVLGFNGGGDGGGGGGRKRRRYA